MYRTLGTLTAKELKAATILNMIHNKPQYVYNRYANDFVYIGRNHLYRQMYEYGYKFNGKDWQLTK